MTDDEAAKLVERLPKSIRHKLRYGPIVGNDAPCRICDVMDQLPSAGFIGRLFAWHLGVDIHGPYGEKLGTGEECYRRCLIIYRAAGWEEKDDGGEQR